MGAPVASGWREKPVEKMEWSMRKLGGSEMSSVCNGVV